MTPAEHYRAAEQLVDEASLHAVQGSTHQTTALVTAQIHATLALAGATFLARPTAVPGAAHRDLTDAITMLPVGSAS